MITRRPLNTSKAGFRLLADSGQEHTWHAARFAVAQASLAALLCALATTPAGAANRRESFLPVPLNRIAVAAASDSMGVWAPEEMAEDPKGSDLYAGTLRVGRDTLIVSQRVSAACGSPSVCPVRVELSKPDGAREILLRQEQACASPAYFAVSADLATLRACGQDVPMSPPGGAPK